MKRRRTAINLKLAHPGLSNYSKKLKNGNEQIIKELRRARYK